MKIAAMILILGSALFARPADFFVFRSHSYMGTTVPYRLFVPKEYDNTLKYPLILTLHGAGERGTDNVVQITGSRLAEVWAEDTNQARFPCIVVSPQCPGGQWVDVAWSIGYYNVDSLPESNNLRAVWNLLDSIMREFPIDTNRIYVTGLSMGGYGTWDMLLRHTARFAAGVPICGGGDSSAADRLMATPIWTAHAYGDGVVPSIGTRRMMAAFESRGREAVYPLGLSPDFSAVSASQLDSLLAAGAGLLYTEYNSSWHGIWDNLYNDPHLPPWLFSWTKPLAHDALAQVSLMVSASDSVPEQYFRVKLTATAGFSGGFSDTVTYSCSYTSLDTGLAQVSLQGVVTCRHIGTVRIEAARRGLKDTVEFRIVPSTAQLDSIRLSQASAGMGVGDTLRLSSTGYYHKDDFAFIADIDTLVLWSGDHAVSLGNGVFTANNAGQSLLSASLDGKTEVCTLQVLSILKRINFQVSSTPFKAGWLADNGVLFASGKGFGWVNPPGGFFSRDDRSGDNFLLKSLVGFSEPAAYRLAVPSGSYVIKTGMGDNVYGTNSEGSVLFGNDTIAKKIPGQGNTMSLARAEVAGDSGALFTVSGPINYLVIISEAGVEMGRVADDGNLMPVYFYPPGFTEAKKEGDPGTPQALSITPNPFNPFAEIGMSVAERGVAFLSIYTLQGRLVERLWSGELSAGTHKVAWNAGGVAAGIYVLEMRVNGSRFQKRVILLK